MKASEFLYDGVAVHIFTNEDADEDEEIEAGKIYDVAAIKRDGKFAKTNKSMGLL